MLFYERLYVCVLDISLYIIRWMFDFSDFEINYTRIRLQDTQKY